MEQQKKAYQQFNAAKEAANATYFSKISGPVEELLSWGYGYRALAAALNEKGYLSQRGKPFTRESVRTLLKNLGLNTAGHEED